MPVSYIRQRSAAPTYQGPGDIVSGATAWYGLRAYSAAVAATGTQKAVNVRRASDNATQDILILTSGALDIASANTFATVDATATASATASTTLNLTGASSTPHVGSTITGTGVVQPCYIISVGSFTAGAGTVVVNAVQTLAAASISMQYGLFVTKLYDQTAGAHDISQATAANQPQLLPSAVNGLPTVIFVGPLQALSTAGNITPATGVVSFSTVANQISGTVRTVWFTQNGLANRIQHANGTANTWQLFGGASGSIAATVSDAAWHAVNAVMNAASSVVNVDGTETTGTVTGNTAAGILTVGEPTAGTASSGISETGAWDNISFSVGNRSGLHTNQSAYWGTP